MKRINKVLLVLVFAASIVATGCSSSKKTAFCGCPRAKGLVGY